jgi:hypothetical protein
MNHEPAERCATVHARAALAAALLLLGATTAVAQASDAKPSDAGATAVALPIAHAPGTTAVAGAAKPTGSQAQQQAASQPPEPMAEAADEPEEFDPPPLRMGDATQGLLAWQRSGEIASSAPRPISGSVASRSYDRYLKSFEHPIPEQLGSTVTKSGGGGGASSGSR